MTHGVFNNFTKLTQKHKFLGNCYHFESGNENNNWRHNQYVRKKNKNCICLSSFASPLLPVKKKKRERMVGVLERSIIQFRVEYTIEFTFRRAEIRVWMRRTDVSIQDARYTQFLFVIRLTKLCVTIENDETVMALNLLIYLLFLLHLTSQTYIQSTFTISLWNECSMFLGLEFILCGIWLAYYPRR